jgi:LPXTG-motif cell wall-anchored protein
VGAQSSLDKGTGDDFQKEAIGTVISIVGILLLIAGLLLLDMRKKRKVVDLDLE